MGNEEEVTDAELYHAAEGLNQEFKWWLSATIRFMDAKIDPNDPEYVMFRRLLRHGGAHDRLHQVTTEKVFDLIQRNIQHSNKS